MVVTVEMILAFLIGVIVGTGGAIVFGQVKIKNLMGQVKEVGNIVNEIILLCNIKREDYTSDEEYVKALGKEVTQYIKIHQGEFGQILEWIGDSGIEDIVVGLVNNKEDGK